MFWIWTTAILLTATADLLAIWLGRRRWRYLLKPGTLCLIIALAATGLPEARLYGYLILAGLLCSVAGDIFLVMPADRFLPGLAAFFAAHLCYVAAFTPAGPFTWPDGAAALALAAAGLFMYGRLKPRVEEGGLRLPVLLYLTVISTMLLRAVLTDNPVLIGGALLFYLSDAILAWNRFIRTFPWADLAVMTSYFAAQYLIALSLVA